MCGNIAIIDFTNLGLWTSDAEMFFQMLLLNSMRGYDSTGIAGIWKTKDVDIIKVKGHPFNLLNAPGFGDWKNRSNSVYNALLGHGRLATKGEISAKNAHPFQRGDITLIHNGTLSNFDKLKNQYEDPKVFQVDSDLAANDIHRLGLEALAKFEGAFAFIWHNAKDGKIRAVRNIERPLYYMEREDKEQYYLSSDPAIFDFVRSKGSIKGLWRSLEAGKMLEFDMDKKSMTVVPVKFYQKVWPVHHNTFPPYTSQNRFVSMDEELEIENYGEMFAAANERAAALLQQPTPEKKPTSGPTTSLTQNNICLKLGDRVNFTWTNYNEHDDELSGAHWTILDGTAILDMPVEVKARYEKNIADILEAGVLQGTIAAITPYGQDKSYVCRLFLKDICPVYGQDGLEPELENTKGEVFLELQDGTNIPKHRFDLLSKSPCDCGKSMTPLQSSNCLVVQGKLFCPACVLASKYPKNG